jgi:hypothetical protein
MQLKGGSLMKRAKNRNKAHNINLSKKICDEGIRVFSHGWNSGNPGAGAGALYVFELEGRYAVASTEDDEVRGPYDDLEALFKENGHLLTVTEATESIECIYLDADNVAEMLTFWAPIPDPDIERLLHSFPSMNSLKPRARIHN